MNANTIQYQPRGKTGLLPGVYIEPGNDTCRYMAGGQMAGLFIKFLENQGTDAEGKISGVISGWNTAVTHGQLVTSETTADQAAGILHLARFALVGAGAAN